MISKRKIDQIGESLKIDSPLKKEELLSLLDWRNTFSGSLDYYHLKLKSKIDQDDVIAIARRLKRIESIKIKLKRFSTMRLSTLQDVAGLRVILTNQESLLKAYTDLRGLPTKHKLKKLNDYHNNPKEDGYRGIHLIYKSENTGLIEIQLRTELEHIWATAVETYGELQSTSFKTGEGNVQWKEFFGLLSSYFAIKENCTPLEKHLSLSKKQISTKLKSNIKKLNVIERLNASTNSMSIIVNKFNESGKTGKYALLELDLESKETKVEIFNKKDVSKAIEIYTKKELSYQNSSKVNIVFVNIENIENIQKTYPNYFLNTQKLLEILSKIILGEF